MNEKNQSLSTCIPLESLLNILLKTNFPVKAMFPLTVLGILLFEFRSVLSPAQKGTGSERVEVSLKNQKYIQNLLKLLEK